MAIRQWRIAEVSGADRDFTFTRQITGLRPLAVHFDSGWNSELAVNNIEHVVKKLRLDLYTVVVDWEEMRDLQLAFFKAGVPHIRDQHRGRRPAL